MNFDLLRKTSLAQFVYQQRALHRIEQMGPHMRAEPYHCDIQEILQIANGKTFENPEISLTGIVDVESPWHAVLYLEEINQYFLSQNERLIFRGQSNSDWDIISSIDRPSLTYKQKEVEKLRARVFVDVMASLSFNSSSGFRPPGLSQAELEKMFPNVRVSAGSYMAAAQHYQIATDLIDWTSDCAVATFFASGGTKDINRKASIYVMKIHDAIDAGFEIQVPPPFIERLHLQRGYFIKAKKSDNPVSLKNLCFLEIRFPSDFYFETFDVIRTRIGKVDLLPPNDPVQQIINTAIELVAHNDIEALSSQEYSHLCLGAALKNSQHYREHAINNTQFWYDYCEKFEQILFWTCYKELGDDIYIDEIILEAIIKSNPDLSLSVFRLWNYFLKVEDVGWDDIKKRRIAYFIETAAKYIDYNQAFLTKTYFEGITDKKSDKI